MIDRDKVISRLQIIRTWAEVGKTSGGIQGEKCLADVVNWIDDALELLKDQEPRVLTLEEEPIKVERHMEETEWNVCGNCGSHVIHKWAYCPYCGKRLKWDD